MDKDILTAWDKNQEMVREWIKTVDTLQFSYLSLLENTIRILFAEDHDSSSPDYNKITEINNGDYQGTLLFVIGGKGYQPCVNEHWFTAVEYGSCSCCDTLQGISGWDCKLPTEDQTQQYWTLCLHMMQRMKRFKEDDEYNE